MIGTSFEMLMYFTVLHETAERIGVSRQRLVRLRERIARQSVDEKVVEEMLSKLDCVKVRDAYDIPSVIIDRGGRRYQENDFLMNRVPDELLEEMGIGVRGFHQTLAHGVLPTALVSKRICKKLHVKIETPRRRLPSVWSYEPFFEEWTSEHSKIIQRMIGQQ